MLHPRTLAAADLSSLTTQWLETESQQGRTIIGVNSMTIGAGVRLGPYEVLAPLGAGPSTFSVCKV